MESRNDVVSDRTREYFHSGSAIRKMFTEGLRLKAQHGAENVADLSIGNPTFEPPSAFSEAISKVSARRDHGRHAYMPNAGYPEVRERVAEHLAGRGLLPDVTADHVIMTTGAAGALNIVLTTILNPGDEVILLRPYFVEYRFYVEAHGGVIRFVDTDQDFSLDIEAIERAINPRTRALIVNSPNNPTGRLYAEEELDGLSELLLASERRFGSRILLLSDEPYRDVVFGERPFVSPATVYPNSFQCYSWSKAFSISGERIGYVAVNPRLETANWPELLGSLSMCNRFLGFVNAPAFMQRVIAESLDAPIDVEHYRIKRDLLCDALDGAGFEYAVPEGAFYIFARTPIEESEFVEAAKRRLLLVVPGTDFGRTGYFRMSYAVTEQTARLASRKLHEFKPILHPETLER